MFPMLTFRHPIIACMKLSSNKVSGLLSQLSDQLVVLAQVMRLNPPLGPDSMQSLLKIVSPSGLLPAYTLFLSLK